MTMKNTPRASRLLLAGLALTSAAMAGAASPLWLRNAAISPDGSTIAFTYKGGIYTVPSTGGQARRLTAAGSYNTAPVWSPDSRRLAFASDREGQDDVYVISAAGGTPVRVTTATAAETPRAWLDNNTILFDASLMPTASWTGGSFLPQTFRVSADGGRPEVFMNVPTVAIDVDKNGRVLYRNRKSYEDVWRKHERSSAPSDIVLFADGRHTLLTSFEGMDADPVWGEGDTFYYTSEEGNDNLNVFSRIIGSDMARQLTHFTGNPVRFLSGSDNGLLAFSQNGELYTMRPGQEPVKLSITIADDDYDSDRVKRYVSSGVTNMVPSPNGDEVAFVIRGDVYVTSTKYKTTRRITDTPGQERCVSFSPDGRSLVYDSERDGKWQLFITRLKNADDKGFTYAVDIEETPLYSCATTAQQPEFSPDGKKVAFLEDRTALRIIDVDSKKAVTALDGKYNYSYADGDVEFAWSPDSRWLLASYIGEGGWNNKDIALVKADGSEVVDLTESGYAEESPRWVLDGKGITYLSGRYGYKNQASWGEQNDVLLMMLDGEAWDQFNRTEEEAALDEKVKEEAKDKDADKVKDKAKDKDKKKAKKDADSVKPLDFDLPNRKYRTRRLTAESGSITDSYLDPKGENIYFTMRAPDGKYNLMKRNLKKGETSIFVADLSGGFEADKKGENLFVLSPEGMKKVKLDDGSADAIDFEALYTRTPSAERAYMFDHVVDQVKRKFYDKDLHGLQWDSIAANYRRFLPHISNSRDFAIVLSELLGELNASHTGGRYRGGGASLPTAWLGAFFTPDYKGDGLQIEEIIARGPLSTKSAGLKKGDVITAIDGEKIATGTDYFPMLEGKSGRKVRLTVKADGKTRDVTVRPISSGRLSDLLYERWVEHNAAVVDSVTGGRLGYVHVQGMDSESYRRVYQDLLGKYRNREGVVVDTRYNGGGWLHNDLMILLSGREYVRYEPQDRYIGSEPWAQWNKPSIMLVNEGNYSDAHGTPASYQALGIGEIAGSPVAGTMTAVWWENLIDPEIIFGIPQVTNRLMGTVMENTTLRPDVLIYNTPHDLDAGKDSQLEGAARRLLQTIDAKK